jgi:hypothetical protein
MSRIFSLINDLTLCYELQAPFAEDYVALSRSEKYDLCKEPKKALVNYVNSKEYNFKDIAQNLHQNLASNL